MVGSRSNQIMDVFVILQASGRHVTGVYDILFSSSEYQETSSPNPKQNCSMRYSKLDKLGPPNEQSLGQEGTYNAWNWFEAQLCTLET